MDLVDVTIRADERMIPCVLTMAETISRGQGMGEDLLLRMRLNLEEILLGLISYGSSFGYDLGIDVSIGRDGDELVYSVRDKGVPFDYSTLENGGYSDIARILNRTDGAELRNLGREGREQTFRLPVPHIDSDDDDVSEFRQCMKPEDFDIHGMRPEECMQVAQCLYDEFGYTYVNEAVYIPERLVESTKDGMFTPYTATAPDGEVAGFMALVRSPRLPGTAEMATVVVKKKFRKCSIMNRMIDNAMHDAESMGLQSVNMEPVAYHPYTQMVSDRMGMWPCAVGFNRIPPDVGTSFEGQDSRRTMLWSAKSFRDEPRTIHVPEDVMDMCDYIDHGLGIERPFGEVEKPSGDSSMTTEYNSVMSIGRTYIDRTGEDCRQRMRRELHGLKAVGCEIAEIMINIQDPSAPYAYEAAKDLGYFCTGMFPVSSGCDYLMMQNTMSRIVDYSSIKTTEPFGKLVGMVRDLDPEGDL